MSRFDDYASRYSQIRLERRNGILQMTLHTDGAPVRWGPIIQAELVDAFTQIGADRGNRIVILTGIGNEFSGPRAEPGYSFYREVSHHITANLLDTIHWNAHRLMTRMLDIEVPMIAAVNGPAMRHSELPLMCDIVIASDDASFEDTAHFKLASQTPGDGIGIVYTMLLGLNRARYFMLTGQVIGAQGGQGSRPRLRADAAGEALAARLGAGRAIGAEERSAAALHPRHVDPAAEEMDRAGGHVPSRPGVAGEARQGRRHARRQGDRARGGGQMMPVTNRRSAA